MTNLYAIRIGLKLFGVKATVKYLIDKLLKRHG